MQLHHLHSTNRKPKKRIARGGKRGTYSGRGVKGQKSRSGHRIRPAVRDLIMRLPKRRGFKNLRKTSRTLVLKLSELTRKLAPLARAKGGLKVTRDTLEKLGMVGTDYRGEIKLLGGGEIDFPIIVSDMKTSKAVKAKIEKAGGRVEISKP